MGFLLFVKRDALAPLIITNTELMDVVVNLSFDRNKNTTFDNGSLGSPIDEERSETR